jgi:hypothetical protein
MSDLYIAGLFLLGWANGLYLGWVLWRRPQLTYGKSK